MTSSSTEINPFLRSRKIRKISNFTKKFSERDSGTGGKRARGYSVSSPEKSRNGSKNWAIGSMKTEASSASKEGRRIRSNGGLKMSRNKKPEGKDRKSTRLNSS